MFDAGGSWQKLAWFRVGELRAAEPVPRGYRAYRFELRDGLEPRSICFVGHRRTRALVGVLRGSLRTPADP